MSKPLTYHEARKQLEACATLADVRSLVYTGFHLFTNSATSCVKCAENRIKLIMAVETKLRIIAKVSAGGLLLATIKGLEVNIPYLEAQKAQDPKDVPSLHSPISEADSKE